MPAFIASLFAYSASALSAVGSSARRAVTAHPFISVLLCLVAGIVVAFFSSKGKACMKRTFQVLIMILSVLSSMVIAYMDFVCWVVKAISAAPRRPALLYVVSFAYLISRGTTEYLQEVGQSLCRVPLLSSLASKCDTHAAPVATGVSPSPGEYTDLCSTYEQGMFTVAQTPNVAPSLSISASILANMSLLRPAGPEPVNDTFFADLVNELNLAVFGMGEVGDMASGTVALAEQTYKEWQMHVQKHADTVSPARAYCGTMARVFEGYSCDERTLPSKVHAGLQQSFDALSSSSSSVISLAGRQHAVLFALHQQLSEVWRVASAEEWDAAAGRHSAWTMSTRGDMLQRINTAQSVQSYCIGLRCSVEVAIAAVHRLVGAMNALAATVAAPPEEPIQIRILLGVLAGSNAAVLDAAMRLKEVLA